MSVSRPDAGRVARRASLRLAVLAAFVVGSLWFSGATTGAQDDDPYGSTTTTTEAEGEPALTCSLGLTAGKVNAKATVTVSNVPFGETVRILIGGVEAGRATAPAAFQDGFTTLEVPITIPDLPPGKYPVTAVGEDFTLRCKVGDGDLFEVLSASADDDGTEVLAFTGTNILILVALALLLLIAGRQLVRKSHRRRRLASR